ncbi:hypothetical protein F442_02701, partial [Phytophthora nicotianae P10297]
MIRFACETDALRGTLAVMSMICLVTDLRFAYQHSHKLSEARSKTEGGKQGIHFFIKEDELLAYGRTDKELCERQHIYNVM